MINVIGYVCVLLGVAIVLNTLMQAHRSYRRGSGSRYGRSCAMLWKALKSLNPFRPAEPIDAAEVTPNIGYTTNTGFIPEEEPMATSYVPSYQGINQSAMYNVDSDTYTVTIGGLADPSHTHSWTVPANNYTIQANTTITTANVQAYNGQLYSQQAQQPLGGHVYRTIGQRAQSIGLGQTQSVPTHGLVGLVPSPLLQEEFTEDEMSRAEALMGELDA